MQRFCNSCGRPVSAPQNKNCDGCSSAAPSPGWPVDPVLGVIVDAGKYYVEQIIGVP